MPDLDFHHPPVPHLTRDGGKSSRIGVRLTAIMIAKHGFINTPSLSDITGEHIATWNRECRWLHQGVEEAVANEQLPMSDLSGLIHDLVMAKFDLPDLR